MYPFIFEEGQPCHETSIGLGDEVSYRNDCEKDKNPHQSHHTHFMNQNNCSSNNPDNKVPNIENESYSFIKGRKVICDEIGYNPNVLIFENERR